MILAAAKQQHCKVIDLGIARDDEEELAKVLDSAFSAGIHILLTSGGVSMGDKDFVKPLLEKRGTVYFHKVHLDDNFHILPLYLILLIYSSGFSW